MNLQLAIIGGYYRCYRDNSYGKDAIWQCIDNNYCSGIYSRFKCVKSTPSTYWDEGEIISMPNNLVWDVFVEA